MSGSCTISISNSPVFSLSSSATSSSPAFFYRHNPFSCRVTATGSSPSTCSSSPSSLALANGFRTNFKDEDFASTSNLSPLVPVKRKRPARLDIPTVSLGFGAPAATPRGPSPDLPMEEDQDGYYAVYCKRGEKRAIMEDRRFLSSA